VSDIEESLRFIERNTRTAYRIERLKRENIPEYHTLPEKPSSRLQCYRLTRAGLEYLKTSEETK